MRRGRKESDVVLRAVSHGGARNIQMVPLFHNPTKSPEKCLKVTGKNLFTLHEAIPEFTKAPRSCSASELRLVGSSSSGPDSTITLLTFSQAFVARIPPLTLFSLLRRDANKFDNRATRLIRTASPLIAQRLGGCLATAGGLLKFGGVYPYDREVYAHIGRKCVRAPKQRVDLRRQDVELRWPVPIGG
jgi:hypothetical protein